MTKTVCYISDKIEISSLGTTKKAIDCSNDSLNDIYILPFIEAAYIIGLCYSTIMENGIDSTSMVNDIKPVSYVFSLAVNRKRLTMTDIIDEKRY